jgi:hypothetical protein
MSDGFEMFIGAVVMVIAMAFVVLGYGMGQYAIASDCKTFGAFEHREVYECKVKK